MENNIQRTELNENTLVKVSNEFGGAVGYVTPHVSRSFAANTSKDIPLSELKDLVLNEGKPGLFVKGYLIIRDERVREILNLEPLNDTNLDEAGIKEMLKSADVKKLETFLQYCSDSNLQKLLRVAVELPIKDLDVANLIQAYTKVNVINAIRDRADDVAAETGVRQRVDGKAPENATTPLRGRQIPAK